MKKMKAKKSKAMITASPAVSVASIKFRPSSRRGTQYQPVLDRMASLKEGQAFTIPVPAGTPVRAMHNRLNAVLKRCEIKAPAGCRFIKRTTAEGQVVIACEKIEKSPKKSKV